MAATLVGLVKLNTLNKRDYSPLSIDYTYTYMYMYIYTHTKWCARYPVFLKCVCFVAIYLSPFRVVAPLIRAHQEAVRGVHR